MESLSRPLQRNHANFSRKLSNANVLSPKTAYDDVFSGPPKLGAPTFSSRLEDYREIFGSSQAARASSIPVLDLSDLDETNVSADFRNSTPDYSSIFVGFRDEYIGMSYDELLAAPKGAHNSSAKTSTPSATKFPHQHSDRSSSLEQNQSYDAVKQYNMSYHKTSQEIKDETKVTTHVAELRAVPGFTCFIDETAPLNKTQDDTRKPPAINDVRQKMDFSATSPPPKKQTRGFVRSRNGSSWDGTYSNSKLFANANANEIHLKSHPSNSNLEKSNSPSNSNLEKSNSSFKTSTKMTSDKEVPRTDARDRSPNSSDEELDANSAAAASVAALKKAIEKAQESIRIAKELMEKKEGSQVFSKKSSKSRSKVKDRKEKSIAPRRIEENSKEMFENTRVVLGAKDLDAAEKCEPATGFFELVNNGKHRRAISAFEQVDRNEFLEMKTSGETLERQEGIAAEKAAEVVVEASELKEDMEREENVFKVSQDPEKNPDKFESTFIVHELENIEGPGTKEVEQIEKKQESCEEVKIEEEFFESQDWDDDKDEEGGVVDRSLELVENEHRQEVPEQQIVEETTKEAVVEEDGEQVLAKRLEEAFNLAENEIRIREVFDSHSNEPKQIETGGHQEREMAKEDIQKDKDVNVKIEEYERTEIDEKIGSDACDWKENGEENISVGEREAEKSIERESDKSEENEEIEVDEKRASDGSNDDEESENDVKENREENEEIQVPEDFNRVSDASNSSSTSETLEEEACQQLDINDEIVKAASPRVSDADRDEKDSSKALHDDGNSENTDSDIGENQIEQNTEDSESASDFENGIDILVDDTEKNKESSNKAREDTGKEEESSSNKSLETEEEEEKDKERVIEELAKKREKERERMVVERAIREARERAFAEARERAERAAVDKVNAQIRQRVMAEARDKLEKSSSSSPSSYQKDAKLKAERAAVERATSEARKRALEKAVSQKTTTSQATPQPVNDKFPGASGDTSRFDGTNSESHQRSKAKLEKHQRIMQRAAKALAEKNMRDVLAQKEQAERNRLSESLDADIKRWSNGKEGNLRALLSTLQYVLGTGSGWQPVSLTEIVTTSAVKKAYRKATLYVHPDKLQQRGASIQQKYICEKVFDLLKAAWNKFNAEER